MMVQIYRKNLALSNWNHEMHESTRKRFLWFNSLCLCVSAGNKIQHTYPCTLNCRDFSCVSWLLKMRYVHHIHGFVTIALAFGETRSTRSVIFLRKRGTEVFWGGIWGHEMHEGTRKWFVWFNSLGESDFLEDNNPCGCGIML